jgi:hypothetical protein
MEKLKEFIQQSIKENPDYAEEITDLFELCKDEIESGESKENEIQLCYSSIYELLEKHS